MKYTDRTNTPLKWNWFLKITLPISFLRTAYSLITTISALFFLDSSNELSSSLSGAGYSMSNMGIFFWPIIINVVFLIVSSITLLYASIGLWRWESCGPKAVIINYLISMVETIYLIVLVGMDPVFMNLVFDTSSIQMSNYLTQSSIYSIYMGSLMLSGLFDLTLLICNAIYYHKRKPLFDENYVQTTTSQGYDAMSIISQGPNADLNDMPVPQEQTAEDEATQQSVEEVEEENTQEIPTQEESDNVKEEPIEQAQVEDVPTQQEIDESSESTEEALEDSKEVEETSPSTFKPYFCTQCGNKITDENTHYCPNCGKKLN